AAAVDRAHHHVAPAVAQQLDPFGEGAAAPRELERDVGPPRADGVPDPAPPLLGRAVDGDVDDLVRPPFSGQLEPLGGRADHDQGQWPHGPCVQTTRSPMASGSPSESTSAPAPMAATSPTISCPSTTGRRQWELPSPRQKWTSVPQIVEASTRTVSAPGSGLPTAS